MLKHDEWQLSPTVDSGRRNISLMWLGSLTFVTYGARGMDLAKHGGGGFNFMVLEAWSIHPTYFAMGRDAGPCP